LSFARRARTSRLQCPSRLDPGITGEYLARSHHWSGGIAAPAHDGENYAREPWTDLGNVLDLGCDRGRPRDQGRSRRGILMCAALVAERTEAPALAPGRVGEPVVRVEGLNHYYGEGEARNQVLFNNHIEIPAGQLIVMTGPSGAGKTTLLGLI